MIVVSLNINILIELIKIEAIHLNILTIESKLHYVNIRNLL
jgi:hypothetical protein